ncbi:MAG: hypothetical protein IT229_02185 [Flavobacteriales bacterium]|nr:hypothetical protein [Flavobacteriales bacterium]
MPSTRFIAPFLLCALTSCSNDHGVELTNATPPLDRAIVRFGRTASAKLDCNFDLIQRTCALYVAVRSSAWNGSIAFGRDMEDDMVRWNKCPGGTKVACVVTPTANGDTVITGIPFTHASIEGH